jgi:hypothetical protein
MEVRRDVMRMYGSSVYKKYLFCKFRKGIYILWNGSLKEKMSVITTAIFPENNFNM